MVIQTKSTKYLLVQGSCLLFYGMVPNLPVLLFDNRMLRKTVIIVSSEQRL